MRLKIPIFVEIDSRMSEKEVAMFKNKFQEVLTNIILKRIRLNDDNLNEFNESCKVLFDINRIEVLTEEEFLNRIR